MFRFPAVYLDTGCFSDLESSVGVQDLMSGGDFFRVGNIPQGQVPAFWLPSG